MTDAELDALLNEPLPDLDTTLFSVELMEAIASNAARPARILSWITVGLLTIIVGVAGVFATAAMGRGFEGLLPPADLAGVLCALSLLLTYSVFQSARE